MSTARRIWRRVVTAAVVGSTGALLLSALTPAGAATKEDGGAARYINSMSVDEYVQRYDHAMGSQIAKVEGDDSTAQTNDTGEQPLLRFNAAVLQAKPTLAGIDVSGHQRNVDWGHWWRQGKRFAYVKATEGTGFKNPYFSQQYNGSYRVGMIRGAYHFALPNRSSGAAQANYFVNNGGGWSDDGKTLPGALDMEYNPYGAACYGKSQRSMAAWIRDFHDTYFERTGRWPVIYTSTSWWNRCVGRAQSFGNTVPLWIARYNTSIGALPHGWSFHTFWQHTSKPIDQNRFNGAHTRLQALAGG
ncbi:lysozyme [Saccharomonospora sp. NPDC046836]|uniref:lysozyme n=1 Tax=Saccharomonospora sp. NPDC046836 TaxID=3156921 RepID=UPI0033DF2C40